jgi:hypothetical protein
MNNGHMISGKKIFALLLPLFFIAVIGFILLLLDINFGRYMVYFGVSLGAIVTMFSGLLAAIGKIEKDF